MISTVEKIFHHWRIDLVDCDLNKSNLRHLLFLFFAFTFIWIFFFFFSGIYSQAISFCFFSFFWDIFFFCATSSSDLGIICSFSVKIISVWPGELMYGLI